MPKVYLAGPITGFSYADCTQWRQYVTRELLRYDICCFSPMRHKEYLACEQVIEDSLSSKVQTLFTDQRAIMTRDFHDCRTADCVFVNLLQSRKVSIGTVMEIAWAHALQIPVVCAMEAEGNPHEHSMIREAIGFRVTTLHDGMMCVRSLLCSE